MCGLGGGSCPDLGLGFLLQAWSVSVLHPLSHHNNWLPHGHMTGGRSNQRVEGLSGSYQKALSHLMLSLRMTGCEATTARSGEVSLLPWYIWQHMETFPVVVTDLEEEERGLLAASGGAWGQSP